MGDTYDVIMAAYPAAEAAAKDFDALVKLVEEKKVRTEGVILVERDVDGVPPRWLATCLPHWKGQLPAQAQAAA